MPTNTASARADTILSYLNSITLSGRTLTYPSSSSAEERAVQWLIEDDLGTAANDEQSLRQRYVLGTLWFLEPTPTTGFSTTTWKNNLNECQWLDVECDGSGLVQSLELNEVDMRGKLPHDLGLLTRLTYLSLWANELSGTIPSSLGALKALATLDLGDNDLSGTIPSSLGALTALTGLWLSGNDLSGTIPSSIVALTALNYFWLTDNRLVGTMPFCNSDQSFGFLVVDCAEVDCTCCTECCPVAFGNIPAYDGCG
jgi:Leucine-rich repeat (LRR) protein